MPDQDPAKKIAENIRKLIYSQSISNAELARRAGLSTGTISKVLNGSMNISISLAISLATGLNVSLEEIFEGLIEKQKVKKISPKSSEKIEYHIGVMSINSRRVTCIKDQAGHIIGTSELAKGLDLAEPAPGLLREIHNSIEHAIPNKLKNKINFKKSRMNLVMQSYEFESTKMKFENYAKKDFNDVIIIPDWQITHFASFGNNKGISIVMEKGVSLSYMQDKNLKKLGGWKFPVYDLGGENWLGLETIHHTIEAFEGFIPETKLSKNVLSKYEGKIEKITETCFKGSSDTDVYSTFADILLRTYAAGDKDAANIIKKGFQEIEKLLNHADNTLGEKQMIAIHGSLADIYKPFFSQNRLINSPNNAQKVELLAEISREYLEMHGCPAN